MDSEGRMYSSAQDMWREETGEDMAEETDQGAKKREWYNKGVEYWAVSDIRTAVTAWWIRLRTFYDVSSD